MARPPASTRDDIITTESFRDVALSAGENLRKEIPEGSESIDANIPFVSFEPGTHEDILNDVMVQFQSQVFEHRHPGGTLHWRKGFMIQHATAFDEETYKHTPKDIWLLALSVMDKGKAGVSLSLHTSFAVRSGDIYLGYEVTKSEVS